MEITKTEITIPRNLFYKFHRFVSISKLADAEWRGETENEEIIHIQLVKTGENIKLHIGIGFNEIQARNNLTDVAIVRKCNKPVNEITLKEINAALDLRWKNIGDCI